MADLVIRGMEIPRDCSVCELSQKRVFASSVMCPITRQTVGYYDQGFHLEKHDCPLVPLPAGHGRIVDAKEVLEKADKAPWFDGDVAELGLLLGSEVTTIIPAEGGTDDGN